jgi:hypothetical protein
MVDSVDRERENYGSSASLNQKLVYWKMLGISSVRMNPSPAILLILTHPTRTAIISLNLLHLNRWQTTEMMHIY